MDPDRIPPSSIETEQAILAACMLDRSAVPRASLILRGDPDQIWYHRGHALIWRDLYDLWDEGEGTDSVSVSNRMRDGGRLEEVGGWDYVHQLGLSAFCSANVEHHAKEVMAKARSRRLIEIGASLQRAGYAADDVGAVVSRGVDELYAVTQDGTKSWAPMSQGTRDAYRAYEAARAADSTMTGISTGLTDLDAMTGGWQDGDLILVAGRPGIGKTSLGIVAALAAAKGGHTVGVVSLEMSARQVGQRVLAQSADVGIQVIRTGRASDVAHAKLAAAAAASYAPIWVDDTPGLTVMDLRARARVLVQKHAAALLVVDYLQLLEPEPGSKADNSERETRLISRALKLLAREADVPVIAMCQLSRGPEARPDKRPQLSDLRYSGALEQDADLVILLHRPEMYGIDDDARYGSTAGICEVIVAKHRQGATGPIRAQWQAESAAIRDLEWRQPQ